MVNTRNKEARRDGPIVIILGLPSLPSSRRVLAADSMCSA